ncbi:hypothetical protein JZ751_028177 [Albula glossodonta]|uniref:Secretin receptor n=1 Tax=Albula glossodonta TaxID=121402 RepID=A0A8T2PBX1_9TELE|nr:hypothetical protein JZ751_028177 [Albula glossodonta]
MKIKRKMKELALLTVFLDIYAQGIPSECEPHNILVKEEESCYNELLRYNLSMAGFTQPGCQGMWDDLNCWPHTLFGETVSQPCPKFLRTKGRVFRNCTAQGWTEAFPPHEIACEYAFNETLMDISESHQYFLYVRIMYTVGYALSLVSLTVAIFILCLFRKLHCTRNYIHIQLFLSFILRAAFIFIKDSVLFSDETLYHCDSFPVGCKLVVMSSHYCIMANYSWLLVEGHYLHTLVRISFFSEKKFFWWYIVLGWVEVSQIWNSVELALSSVQVQGEFQRKWRRWRLKQHLHGESRPQRGSLSHSGTALTQVSLLHRGSAIRQASQV